MKSAAGILLLCALVASQAATPCPSSAFIEPDGRARVAARLSGYVEHIDYGSTYNKRGGNLKVGFESIFRDCPPHEYWYRSYLEFDLSAIPDSAVLSSVELRYFQYRTPDLDPLLYVALIPSVEQPAESLYQDLCDGEQLSDTARSATGWNTKPLSQRGVDVVDSCMFHHDRVSLGLTFPGDYTYIGEAYGYTAYDSVKPYLDITYLLGVSEGASTPELGRAFQVRPNPVHGQRAALLTVPTPFSGRIQLSNIAGRKVWTRRLAGGRTGTVQLPFLPAGVYLVRLQSASFTATEKLVVQR